MKQEITPLNELIIRMCKLFEEMGYKFNKKSFPMQEIHIGKEEGNSKILLKISISSGNNNYKYDLNFSEIEVSLKHYFNILKY